MGEDMKTRRMNLLEQRGVTVIELLTVMITLAIIAAIGMPEVMAGIRRTGVDGASRRLADDIRLAQSTALSRGLQARLIAFNDSGVAANPGSADITDATKANMYRIEVRPSPTASWPALTDDTTSGGVVTVWSRVAADYRGVSIGTGNTVVFNSQGFLINSTSPLNIVLQGAGGTKTVQTSVIGKATIQ
jgi:Tfp pilus assembly protein FimT